jgi:hypothetical protein
MTDPAALLTRLEQAKQSRDVWELHLAEQALEHAAPELAARVLELEAENARLREGRDKLIKASEAVCENDAKHASDKALLWDLVTTIAALKGGEI